MADGALVEQFEEELLNRQFPRGCVLDLDLGSSNVGRATADEIARWSGEISFSYVRGGHVDTRRAYRDLATSHLNRVATSHEVTVVLSARTQDDWAMRKQIVEQIAAKYPDSSIIPVPLHRAAVVNSEVAKHLIAEAILRHWGALPPVPIDRGGRELGIAAREAAACEPFVLAVGGNEKQQRAMEEFPARLAEEFGIEGQWIPTDYGRPGQVVDEIKTLCERMGPRLIGVIFAQLFNATDVKRDGQKYLRSKGVLSLTPAFKSVGSALAAVQTLLRMYVRGEAAEEEQEEAPDG